MFSSVLMSLWMTDTHTHSVSYKSSSQPTFVHHLPPTYICSHSIVHACFQLFNFSLYCEHYWEELCGWVSQKHRMSHPGKPCICSSPASSLHLDPPHPSHPFPNCYCLPLFSKLSNWINRTIQMWDCFVTVGKAIGWNISFRLFFPPLLRMLTEH